MARGQKTSSVLLQARVALPRIHRLLPAASFITEVFYDPFLQPSICRHTHPSVSLLLSLSLSRCFAFEFRCSSFARHTSRFIDREVGAISNFTALGNCARDWTWKIQSCRWNLVNWFSWKPLNLAVHYHSRNISFRSSYTQVMKLIFVLTIGRCWISHKFIVSLSFSLSLSTEFLIFQNFESL